ncbi:MAG: COG1361 S-layer family protein [Euryarchaeota archaeon]|nr:COG1361 S-layer family protein [Euryarchaeota archaeon]
MEKSIIIAILALAFIIAPASAELELVLDKLSPQPVEPGQDLVLSISLVNEFSEIDNVKLTILPDSPIILKNENDRIINIGKMIKFGAVVETYSLHIDSLAVSGAYEVEFQVHWLSNDQQRETNKTFNIIVRGVPQLAISNIIIEPEIISPGDNFNLNFSVSNNGTGIASAIRVTSLIENLPFISTGTNTRVIGKLSPASSKKLEYRLLAKDNAEPASYSIPIRLDYQSEDGRNFSSSEIVGVNVLGKGRLNIAGINTDPSRIEKGNYLTLTIRIENAGNGNAKSVKANIDIPFRGTKTAFLGKIEPDNDAPAIFNLYADDAGEYKYNLTIQYEDDLGTHETREELMMTVSPGDRTSVFIIILFIVAVIGACWFFIRRK